jgi:hypothetical protein
VGRGLQRTGTIRESFFGLFGWVRRDADWSGGRKMYEVLETGGNIHRIYDAMEMPFDKREFKSEVNKLVNQKRIELIKHGRFERELAEERVEELSGDRSS